MFRIFSLLVALTFLLLACSTNKANEKTTNNVDNKPGWIYNPVTSRYVGVVGVGAKQEFGGLAAQQRVALTRARAELGRMIKLHVDAQTDVSEKLSQSQVTRSATSSSRVSSSVALDLSDAFINKKWIDPETGEFYIWLVIEKKL